VGDSAGLLLSANCVLGVPTIAIPVSLMNALPASVFGGKKNYAVFYVELCVIEGKIRERNLLPKCLIF